MRGADVLRLFTLHSKGAQLCRQEKKPELLHIVLSGAVGLFVDNQRDETLVEFLLTVRLLEAARVLFWPAAAFREAIPEGRRLVAGRLGATPQSLSRAFAALRPLGVSGDGRAVTIADPRRLRELSPALDG